MARWVDCAGCDMFLGEREPRVIVSLAPDGSRLGKRLGSYHVRCWPKQEKKVAEEFGHVLQTSG